MKHILWRQILLSLLFSLVLPLLAQPATDPLPLDPAVKTGKLPNGLTYYIRKNLKPEKRVELRLAVNTGSVQEDADQLGLAHFVEHMCFKGTARFPGIEVIHYLQSIGSDFGPDINAYTSFDQTVYQLTLPSDKPEILSNGLKIMEDWAHAVSFLPADIDSERKVVVEEWRIGRGPEQRMRDKYLPVLFKGSKYAERLPIGTKESIENSSHDALKRFYKDWYRPDNMAFIVVGDIDPESIEKAIQEGFGKIPADGKPRKVEPVAVPDHQEPLYSIISDKENPYNVAMLIWKTSPGRIHTVADLRRDFAEDLVLQMLNERLGELRRQAQPPFIHAQVRSGKLYTRAKDAFQAFVVVPDGGFEAGIASVLTEIERSRRHGFTSGELERAKKSMLKSLEQAYNERDKTPSAVLVGEYVSHFLEQEAAPGIDYVHSAGQALIPGLGLGEINRIPSEWIQEENQVIILQSVEKQGLTPPTEELLRQTTSRVRQAEIAPYAENKLPESLLPSKPAPGRIVSTKEIPELGLTELQLSNGIRVVLKPSRFQNDQILLDGFRPGGSSLLPDSLEFSSQLANAYNVEAGAGDFDATKLQKFLAGKKAGVGLSTGQYEDRVSGGCVVSDLPTLFELLHLRFTQPRADANAYASIVGRQKAMLKNLLSKPNIYFQNEVQKILYNNHPRNRNVLPSDEDWAGASLEKVLQVNRASFGNANGFTFIIVGSFELETIRPLIETYLASLPSSASTPGFKDLHVDPIAGPLNKEIRMGKDPKSLVIIDQSEPVEWSRDEAHKLWSLGRILERIYIDKLREEMSGVYGLGVSAGLRKIPAGRSYFHLQIPCSPQNADKLVAAAMEEIRRIQKEGLKPEEIQKEVEAQRRAAEKDSKENSAWLGKLVTIYRDGEPFTRLSNPEELISLVNADTLQKAARSYINVDKMLRFTLYPEQEAEAAPENKPKE